jgi:hypothetical protein
MHDTIILAEYYNRYFRTKSAQKRKVLDFVLTFIGLNSLFDLHLFVNAVVRSNAEQNQRESPARIFVFLSGRTGAKRQSHHERKRGLMDVKSASEGFTQWRQGLAQSPVTEARRQPYRQAIESFLVCVGGDPRKITSVKARRWLYSFNSRDTALSLPALLVGKTQSVPLPAIRD